MSHVRNSVVLLWFISLHFWLCFHVTEAPYLSDEDMPTNISAIENNTVTLPCPVLGTPTPQVRWYKNGQALTSNQSGLQLFYNGSLLLLSAQMLDAGQYTCVAENDVGNLTRYTYLQVFCKYWDYTLTSYDLCKMQLPFLPLLSLFKPMLVTNVFYLVYLTWQHLFVSLMFELTVSHLSCNPLVTLFSLDVIVVQLDCFYQPQRNVVAWSRCSHGSLARSGHLKGAQ